MEHMEQEQSNSWRKRIGIAFQRHYIYPLIVCLLILSLYLPDEGLNFGSIIQITYLSIIIVALSYNLIRLLIGLSSRQREIEVLFLLILAVDLIIRITGGAESFLLPSYFLVIVTAAFYYKFSHIIASIFLIIFLNLPWIEFIKYDNYNSSSLQRLLILASFLMAIGGVSKAISWSQERRRLQLVSEIARMKTSLDQLDSAAEETTLAHLSAEEQLSLSAAFIVEMDRVLKDLLVLVRKSLGAYSALLWQLDYKSQQLLLRTYDSLSPHIDAEIAINVNQGIYEKVAQEGPHIFRAKYRLPSEELEYYQNREDITCIAAAPLKGKEDLLGILAIDSKIREGFTNQQLLVLSHYADHIVDLIDLYRQARSWDQQAQEIRAFYQAAQKLASYINLGNLMSQLIELASNIAEFHAFALVILSRDQLYYIIKKIEGFNPSLKNSMVPNDSYTWLSWFLRNQKEPLVISDFAEERKEMPLLSPNEGNVTISSFVALSLRVKDRPLGALILGGKEREQFSGTQARMLSILCSQASLALENALIHQRIGRMAITDGLTELYNHRYFQESINREIVRQDRIQGQFSLLLLDIDDFKKLNDEYGHQAGDLVLKGISTILKKEAREADMLARYGGEEFALLLLDSDKKGALRTGERIRHAIEEHRFKLNNRLVKITISGGIACWPSDAQEKQLLIKKADMALYYSKEKGKNKISHINQVKK
jgi:diguanylate cyclase (GGDEF)-like protein